MTWILSGQAVSPQLSSCFLVDCDFSCVVNNCPNSQCWFRTKDSSLTTPLLLERLCTWLCSYRPGWIEGQGSTRKRQSPKSASLGRGPCQGNCQMKENEAALLGKLSVQVPLFPSGKARCFLCPLDPEFSFTELSFLSSP